MAIQQVVLSGPDMLILRAEKLASLLPQPQLISLIEIYEKLLHSQWPDVVVGCLWGLQHVLAM